MTVEDNGDPFQTILTKSLTIFDLEQNKKPSKIDKFPLSFSSSQEVFTAEGPTRVVSA